MKQNSPMAMFTRIAMSTVPAYQIVLSILILVLLVGAVGVLSARIYRVGVLLYGTAPKPAESGTCSGEARENSAGGDVLKRGRHQQMIGSIDLSRPQRR